VTPPTGATRGTGAIVRAEPDIVEAARAECERLDYTGNAECVGQPRGDYVEIASGAGRYHPVFYAVVGLPTLALDGVAALYGMRLVALLLCLLVLAAAFKAVRAWDEPLVAGAVLCGLTPMVLALLRQRRRAQRARNGRRTRPVDGTGWHGTGR
jgi:hypothetical protein